MAHQLIFTSLEKTLLGGAGYGVAAETPHFPRALADDLSKLAGYAEIYPARDANRQWNPVNYFYVKHSHWFVLGRLSSADNDYSERSNFLGQFYCLEASELHEAGPAALLQALPFEASFQGPARMLAPCVLPNLPPASSLVCKQWADLVGDAGWGGVFAQRLKNEPTVSALYDRTLHGEKSLALVAESIALLDPADRWAITFSTHVDGFPRGNQVHLRMLQQGAEHTRDFKAQAHGFDLTKTNWGQPQKSPWVEMARTGIRPAHWGPPAVPPAPHAGSTERSGSRHKLDLDHGAKAPAHASEKGHSVTSKSKSDPGLNHPPVAGKGSKGKSSAKVPGLAIPPTPFPSSKTPSWIYGAAVLGIFLAFGLGVITGMQMSRTSLEESAEHARHHEEQLKDQEKSIQDLTEKNAALTTQKEGLEATALQSAKDKEALQKYKDFLVGNGKDQANLLSKASEKDEENLKSARQSLQNLAENSQSYLAHKDRITRMTELEKSYKLYKELEEAKKTIINDPVMDESLRSGLSFDKKFQSVIADRMKQKEETANDLSLLKSSLSAINSALDKKPYKLLGTKEDLFGEKALEETYPSLFTEKTGEFKIDGKNKKEYFDSILDDKKTGPEMAQERNALAEMILSMSKTCATTGVIMVDNKISYPLVRFLTNQGERIKAFGDKRFQGTENLAVFEQLKTVIDKLIELKGKKAPPTPTTRKGGPPYPNSGQHSRAMSSSLWDNGNG